VKDPACLKKFGFTTLCDEHSPVGRDESGVTPPPSADFIRWSLWPITGPMLRIGSIEVTAPVNRIERKAMQSSFRMGDISRIQRETKRTEGRDGLKYIWKRITRKSPNLAGQKLHSTLIGRTTVTLAPRSNGVQDDR
jgi:hypothetical protein